MWDFENRNHIIFLFISYPRTHNTQKFRYSQ